MALATLGLFVFSLPTVPLQDWDEGHAWRHPSQTTVGGSGQPTQFTGKDNGTDSGYHEFIWVGRGEVFTIRSGIQRTS